MPARKGRTREYNSYRAMHGRCRDPNNVSWKRYGGRGIKVCDEWTGRGGFDRFLAYMGPRPPGMSIDRIDKDGHYEPGNVRWADKYLQARDSGPPLKRALDARRRDRFGVRWAAISRLYTLRDTMRFYADLREELESTFGPPRNMDPPKPHEVTVESYFWDEDFDVNCHTGGLDDESVAVRTKQRSRVRPAHSAFRKAA